MQALLGRGALAFVAHQHHRADTYSGTEIKEGRDHRGRNHLQHHLRYGRADGIEGGGENGQKDGHALAFLVHSFHAINGSFGCTPEDDFICFR